MVSKQGQKAANMGKSLETAITNELAKYFEEIDKNDMWMALELKQGKRVFCKQYKGFDTIYKRPAHIDFFLIDPEKYPKGMAIEVKRQKSAGSVDEKFPFVIENMKLWTAKYGTDSALFLDGGGYNEFAKEWCMEQQNKKLLVIESYSNIIEWLWETFSDV